MKATDVKRELKAAADPEKAAFYPRFFKTGKGEYGEGDRFVGVVVPQQRRIARRFRELPLGGVKTLLQSPFHEHRNTALLILAEKVRRGDESVADEIYDFTLRHVERIDNWDLVDLAAPKLIGPRLLARRERRKLLDDFAASPDLWKRRIAVLSTLAFIRAGEFGPTLRLARKLLDDPHDLIHKAVGWMLREVGNRERSPLLEFLDRHAAEMPRTMLRYAIEKLPKATRARYMKRGVKPRKR